MLTLEGLLAGKGYADLAASPLQVAIARAADGRALAGVLGREHMQAHFGADEIEAVLPALLVVVAGVRGGKSFLAACLVLTRAMTADLGALKPHEVARGAIVAPTVDNATATYRLLVGIVRGSKVLSALVVGDPTAEAVTLRRPDGRVVEVVVVAAHRGAVTLRSRWLFAFVLDEVALFGTEGTGAVVNAEELLRAGETRLVPGGQGCLISSPFGPQGLLFDLWREHFGKPSADVLVVHAPTRAMNPSFPEEKIERIRKRDPDTAAREYDAQWLDASTSLLDGKQLTAAQRVAPAEMPARNGVHYVAASDPATRGNSWTLVVAHAERVEANGTPRVVIDAAWQWTGSKSAPLSPREVLAEQARNLRPYGVRVVYTDQWSNDALRDIGADIGLDLVQQTITLEMYLALRTIVSTGALELPPDKVLRQDLAGLRRKVTANGVRVELPHTADGRHADYAPAVTLAVEHAGRDAAVIDGGSFTTYDFDTECSATIGVGDMSDEIARHTMLLEAIRADIEGG